MTIFKTKTCLICKEEFESKRDDAKCCSPKCRKRYSRNKDVTEEVTDKCDKPLDGTCKYCGKTFTLEDGPLFELMECCHKCSHERHRFSKTNRL